ncbi:MAG: endonuclease/exonuclease/phosphatase family protein [Parvibaculum sp.]|nr:endonuclease/exonuclease/phosphatase family protein [Parvibaculum sp.]
MREHGLRVLSWNVHGGVGPDRRYDFARIVELIRRHNPDVIALQEIDSRGRGGDGPPLSLLREALGEHAAEARTISAPDGHYGHIIVSRFPLSTTRLHDLSFGSREPRCAIATQVETSSGCVRLVTTHLGLSIRERRSQSARLAALARGASGPCIMMGDFNDWFSFGWVRRRLKTVLPWRTRERTFPAWYPLLRLDRVYCSASVRIVKSWTDERASRISDHLPIIADISLGGSVLSAAAHRPVS